MTDSPTYDRRGYYDHEPAYRERLRRNWTGWSGPSDTESFRAFDCFEKLPCFPAAGLALDLGCGGGELCVRLHRAGWTVVGVEFSETALAMALRNSQDAGVSSRFLQADLTRPIPVVRGRFNLVLDNHVLHCLIDCGHRRTFLANARDALAPDGVFFSANMSREGRIDCDNLQIERNTGISTANSRKWVTYNEILAEFTEAGLAPFEVTRIPADTEPAAGDEIVICARPA